MDKAEKANKLYKEKCKLCFYSSWSEKCIQAKKDFNKTTCTGFKAKKDN